MLFSILMMMIFHAIPLLKSWIPIIFGIAFRYAVTRDFLLFDDFSIHAYFTYDYHPHGFIDFHKAGHMHRLHYAAFVAPVYFRRRDAPPSLILRRVAPSIALSRIMDAAAHRRIADISLDTTHLGFPYA